MEIIRYVSRIVIERFKANILDIKELIESSTNKKDKWYDIPIKIIIPEEGVVIAEGELFLSQENGITKINNKKFINVDEKLYKYQGKKGKLIFIIDPK